VPGLDPDNGKIKAFHQSIKTISWDWDEWTHQSGRPAKGWPLYQESYPSGRNAIFGMERSDSIKY